MNEFITTLKVHKIKFIDYLRLLFGDMIFQKALSFLLARGLPGLISLLSIMLYTRLLSPEIYGQYAIVISLVVLTITMCFQWMQFSILRFYPKQAIAEKSLLSSMAFSFILISLVVIPLMGILLGLSLDFLSLPVLFIVLLLIFFHAFFDMSVQLPVAQGKALFYGLVLAGKSTLGLIFGLILLFSGFTLAAPITGLALAYFLVGLLVFKKYWLNLSWHKLDKSLIQSMMRYGMPLSGTFIMNFIMANSDRLMLAWMMGEESTGLYAAGYDLSNFSFIVILMSIHLAIYPMIVKAYEEKKAQQTQHLLEQNLVSLALFSIVPGILFTFLVVDFSQLVFGDEFWQVAAKIIPIVTLATFFLGLKAYYFDLAFLLSQKTKHLLSIGLAGSMVNIVLNYFMINIWGIPGAAYSTCLSYFLILCLSYYFGKKLVSMPIPFIEMGKVLLVLVICLLVLLVFNVYISDNFFLNFVLLSSVYLSMVYYFNFLDCQAVVKNLRDFSRRKISEV